MTAPAFSSFSKKIKTLRYQSDGMKASYVLKSVSASASTIKPKFWLNEEKVLLLSSKPIQYSVKKSEEQSGPERKETGVHKRNRKRRSVRSPWRTNGCRGTGLVLKLPGKLREIENKWN